MTSHEAFIPAARPLIGEDERRAVNEVLESGLLAQGPEVARFEKEFSSELLDGRSVVAVNSGTSALHLGLLANGIGPGDEVIVPSFTFAATANSVALTGATPVFADIEPEYFCLSPESVREHISERTAGIMPVHLYGHPADMEELGGIAAEAGLKLFEDAAQAHGAMDHGRYVGTFGAFAAFSLYPTKNMTAGEGGMIASDIAEVTKLSKLLRNQGMERQYENEIVGFNARMTDIHAAIGRQQLTKIGKWTEQRRQNAAFFDNNLESVVTPRVRNGATHVYHQYTLRISEDRDRFAAALRTEYNVGCGVYYPIPNHRLPSFDSPSVLPETERACAEVLSIPVHPSLTHAELDRIVVAVNTLARAGA